MCKCTPRTRSAPLQPEQESIFRTVFAGWLRFRGIFRRSLRATTKKKRSSTFLAEKFTPRQNPGYAYGCCILCNGDWHLTLASTDPILRSWWPSWAERVRVSVCRHIGRALVTGRRNKIVHVSTRLTVNDGAWCVAAGRRTRRTARQHDGMTTASARETTTGRRAGRAERWKNNTAIRTTQKVVSPVYEISGRWRPCIRAPRCGRDSRYCFTPSENQRRPRPAPCHTHQQLHCHRTTLSAAERRQACMCNKVLETHQEMR